MPSRKAFSSAAVACLVLREHRCSFAVNLNVGLGGALAHDFAVAALVAGKAAVDFNRIENLVRYSSGSSEPWLMWIDDASSLCKTSLQDRF